MMSNKVQHLRNRLEQQKGERFRVEKNINVLKRKVKLQKRDLRLHEQAREVIRQVALNVQSRLQYHISDITSLAFEAIFDDPPKLTAEFVLRRNKTECDLYFLQNNERLDPLTEDGGGAADVGAFALRVASWSMQNPKSRNTIILDEPFKFLRGNQERISAMIKEISRKLNIQFIIITQEPILTSRADKVFDVTIQKGITKISSARKVNWVELYRRNRIKSF